MRLRRAIAQSAVLAVLAAGAGFVFNAFSVNGIDPFDHRADVPVIGGAAVDTAGAEAREGIRFIGIGELREMLQSGRMVLDARARSAYESGHIPGALLCDYYDMGRCLDEVLPLLNPYEEIGLYCTGPLCDDAEMLARELYELGYRRLSVFSGGIEAWENEGLPLEEGMPEVP